MALNIASIRDTKWLTLEVCRQFQRGTCSRSDEECKFAHPPKSCQVENGRVIACFDSLKVSVLLFLHDHLLLYGLQVNSIELKINQNNLITCLHLWFLLVGGCRLSSQIRICVRSPCCAAVSRPA